jgi:hypothetical protein
MGWNILVFVGYLSNALLMFAFIRWLTKNNWAAFFAAYAVSFTPFHYFATLGQIAGLYSSVFILAIWQYLALRRSPSRWKAVALGLTFGVSFYMDGYYTLFAFLILGGFWLATVSYMLLKKRQLLNAKEQKLWLLDLAIASGVAALLLAPLLWINLHFAKQIHSIFATARGNVAFEAQTYSAQPSMYLNSKSLIFISFTVALLAAAAVWYIASDYRKRSLKQLRAEFTSNWTLLIVGVIALWTSLRPVGHLLGLKVYNPSQVIIALTPNWRVFGRLYSVVAICAAALAALTLIRLMQRFSKYRFLIFGLCMVLTATELSAYLRSSPQYSFNYAEPPAVYSWLKDNPQVRAVAEYPLEELPQGAYLSDYYTFQEISHKPMLNSLLPDSPDASLRRSIAGINDPQTLPVLRALGIDLVNIRPLNPSTEQPDVRLGARRNKELERKFSFEGTSHFIDSFMIKPGSVASYALTIPTIQYFQLKLDANGHAQYLVDDDIKLAIVELPQAVPRPTVTLSFDIEADTNRHASIVQNGTTLWRGTLTPHKQHIQVDASTEFSLTVYTQHTAAPTHTTIENLLVAN